MFKLSNSLLSTVVVSILVISACSGGSEEITELENVSDNFRSYPVDIAISDTKLSELIDEVELMRLEETDESLLGSVFKVSEAKGKIIFPGDSEGNMHTFSATGEFLSRFNNKGEGPGQYGMISTIWMEGDSIVIYDGLKQTVRWYDGDGNHLKDHRLAERAAHVYPSGEGYVLDMSFRAIQDSLKYQVLLMDKALTNNQEKMIPYEFDVPFPIVSSVSSFEPFNNKLTFKSPFADTTYFVGASGAVPFYHIDFGDKYLWADRSLYENGSAGMKAINTGEGVWIFKTFTGPKHIFMTYNTSFSDSGLMLIQRESGKYVRLNLSKNPEEKYSFSIIGWAEDRLMVSLSSIDVADLLGELNENQWRFREGTTLEEVESSENPVILWLTLKDLKE